MTIETNDTFGNYLIHGIDEIILPNAVSWWPSTPAWQVIGILISFYLIYVLYFRVRRWWRNRYRREVLRQLTHLQQQAEGELQLVVDKLPYFIKVTALQAYPRCDVASLSGENWLRFLDAHYTGPPFSEGTGKKLLDISYLPKAKWQLTNTECRSLITMSLRWIKEHRESAHV